MFGLASHLCAGILSIDLGQRLTLENIASHPWFSGDINAPAMGAGSGVSSAAAGGGATAPLSSPVSEPPDAAQKGIDWWVLGLHSSRLTF